MMMNETKKILVIDDEPDVSSCFEAIFQDGGYNTVSAKDGIEGFELAKSKKPDLITLDITMPKQSGLKIYHQFKKHPELKDVPIIIITAVDDFLGIFLDGLKDLKPPEGIFYKPIDPREVMKLITKILTD